MLNNPPPQNIEAEQQILGAILLDNLAMDRTEGLTSDDFYKKEHSLIFGAAALIKESGDLIDFITLADELEKRDQLEEAGGKSYIFQLATVTPTAANISYHSRIVRNLSLKRKALKSFYSLYSKIDELSLPEISDRLTEITKTLDLPTEKHREISLAREVEKWINLTDGDFSITDCDNALRSLIGLTIPYTKNNLHQIFHRLKDIKIQKVGSKNGIYRRIDDSAEEIDWFDASTEPLDIRCPLDAHNYVAIFPKNIILVAGEPNTGKTAFMLNVAHMNMHRHKVTYLSSEMGAIELKNRLLKFSDIPLSDWKKIKFKERSANFADIVDPAGLTLIDFLEINDDFYRIGVLLKEIYDKLTSGVCIIAIQKNKGNEFGRGGQMAMEKPRLYITMEAGVIKIKKAKAWAKEGVNPNGLQREFKLVQGSKFIADGPWHREDEKF